MTRQRNDDQRKQEIRDAATRCFVRRGYAATRLLDIAKEAGLSKGGVYFHYKAKEQIFLDILESHSRAVQDRWDFEPVGDQPADRTMGRLVMAHLRTMQDEPDEVRLHNLLVSMAVQDSAFRKHLDDLLGIMLGLYTEVIERGIGEGVFVSGEARELAISVLAYVNGLGSLSSLDGQGRLPVSVEHAAEQVLRMLRSHSSASSVEFADPSKGPN